MSQWPGRIYLGGKSKQRERERMKSGQCHGAAEEAVCEVTNHYSISLAVKHKLIVKLMVNLHRELASKKPKTLSR